MSNNIQFLSPDGLHKNPAFSQLVIVPAGAKTVYIGGQNAMNKNGEIEGKGNLEKQTKQVLHNLEFALKAAGATFDNVVKWQLYVLQGQSLEEGFKAFQSTLGPLKNPPVITMAFVAALAHPDYLLEMDAVAVITT